MSNIGNISEEEEDKYKVRVSGGKTALVKDKEYLIKNHIQFGTLIDTEIPLHIGKFVELSGNNVRFDKVVFYDDDSGQYYYYEKEEVSGGRKKTKKRLSKKRRHTNRK